MTTALQRSMYINLIFLVNERISVHDMFVLMSINLFYLFLLQEIYMISGGKSNLIFNKEKYQFRAEIPGNKYKL